MTSPSHEPDDRDRPRDGAPRDAAWDERVCARLDEALEDLEHTAGDPVVPGDVLPWCETARRDLQRARRVLDLHRPRECELLDEVFSQDAAQGPRVQALHRRALDLRRRGTRLMLELEEEIGSSRDPRSGAEPTDDARLSRERLLGWGLEVRTFHRELGASLSEALLRDRGVKD